MFQNRHKLDKIIVIPRFNIFQVICILLFPITPVSGLPLGKLLGHAIFLSSSPVKSHQCFTKSQKISFFRNHGLDEIFLQSVSIVWVNEQGMSMLPCILTCVPALAPPLITIWPGILCIVSQLEISTSGDFNSIQNNSLTSSALFYHLFTLRYYTSILTMITVTYKLF